ncbi:hypothetical protein ACIRFH_28155 [Streptomyces sp. NPDC093586]|uniref:hypothetical protein n=1 Tax=Streptomyces sp. NPDC093586 TaxID=3366042 RepID=UPI0037F81465
MAAVLLTPRTADAAVADTSIYPVQSIYPLSADYRLTVNGRNVPVQRNAGYNGYQGYDTAQFAMGDGDATLAVTKVNNTNIGAYSISPRKLGITGSVSGPTLTFTVHDNAYLIVKVDGRPDLVIAIDPGETSRGVADVGQRRCGRLPLAQLKVGRCRNQADSPFGGQNGRRPRPGGELVTWPGAVSFFWGVDRPARRANDVGQRDRRRPFPALVDSGAGQHVECPLLVVSAVACQGVGLTGPVAVQTPIGIEGAASGVAVLDPPKVFGVTAI